MLYRGISVYNVGVMNSKILTGKKLLTIICSSIICAFIVLGLVQFQSRVLIALSAFLLFFVNSLIVQVLLNRSKDSVLTDKEDAVEQDEKSEAEDANWAIPMDDEAELGELIEVDDSEIRNQTTVHNVIQEERKTPAASREADDVNLENIEELEAIDDAVAELEPVED